MFYLSSRIGLGKINLKNQYCINDGQVKIVKLWDDIVYELHENSAQAFVPYELGFLKSVKGNDHENTGDGFKNDEVAKVKKTIVLLITITIRE
jgi:hypothetical protein